jgi:hypothetical protein
MTQNYIKNTNQSAITSLEIVNNDVVRFSTIPNNIIQTNESSLVEPVQPIEITPVQMIRSDSGVNDNKTVNNMQRNQSNPIFKKRINFQNNSLERAEFFNRIILIVSAAFSTLLIFSRSALNLIQKFFFFNFRYFCFLQLVSKVFFLMNTNKYTFF